MQSFLRYFIGFISLLIMQSCNTNEPENKPVLSLTVEDVTCTEAWVKISFTAGADVILTKNDTTIINLHLNKVDTLLIEESLEPGKAYNYKASISYNNETQEAKASAITLMPTSHEFTWTIFTFEGVVGSSWLDDVKIINDNNIWAVGTVYQNDSLGNIDYEAYGAIHWDGEKCTPTKMISNFNDIYSYSVLPTGIYAFETNDIWLINGPVYHSDGNVITHSYFINYFEDNPSPILREGEHPLKGFGYSSNDFYVCGYKGALAHFDGNKWTRLESGTDADIWGIYGIKDERTGKRKIYCSASNLFSLSEYKILTIDENQKIDSIRWGMDRRVHSVWTKNGTIIYAAGDGFWTLKRNKWEETYISPIFIRNMTAQGNNDIILCGDFGLLAHYNGIDWRIFNFAFPEPDILQAIDIKGNIAAVVGIQGGKAFLAIGRR